MHGGEDLKSNDVITIDNSQIETAFDSLLPILQKTMPQVMKRIGSQIVDIARPAAPKDEGRLEGSITFLDRQDGLTFEVYAGSNLEYAPYNEFGTGHRGYSSGGRTYKGHDSGVNYTAGWPGMEAHPYMRPALYDFEGDYAKMVDEASKDAFKMASERASTKGAKR